MTTEVLGWCLCAMATIFCVLQGIVGTLKDRAHKAQLDMTIDPSDTNAVYVTNALLHWDDIDFTIYGIPWPGCEPIALRTAVGFRMAEEAAHQEVATGQWVQVRIQAQVLTRREINLLEPRMVATEPTPRDAPLPEIGDELCSSQLLPEKRRPMIRVTDVVGDVVHFYYVDACHAKGLGGSPNGAIAWRTCTHYWVPYVAPVEDETQNPELENPE